MGELWLVRHGETEWSRVGRHTGRTDLALTTEGERQARVIGARLAGQAFAAVRVSPLRRALTTCALAGLEAAAQVAPDLAEWNYGEYEGRTAVEIRAERPGWNIWDGGVVAGETVEEVAARADRAIAEAVAAAGEGAALLFAHGHLLRVLATRWLALQPRDARLLTLGPARLSILGVESDRRVLRLWNAEGP
jgi:broad specificity phosphatase PhoE